MLFFEKLKSFAASRYFFVFVLAIYLFAAFYKIHHQGPSKDELTTFSNMYLTIDQLVANRLVRGHVPFYFIALKGWTSIFGVSYPALIGMSVAFGCLTLWGMAALAGRLGWGRYGWAFAAMLCMHPTFLYFSRFARPWMGLACLSIWIIFIWVQMLGCPPQRRRNFLLACWCILAIIGAGWNFLLAGTWAILGLGTLLSPSLRRRCPDAVGLGIAFGLLAHVAMGVATLSNGRGMAPVAWIKPLPLTEIAFLVEDWFGGKLDHRFGGLLKYGIGVIMSAMTLYGAWRLYFCNRPRHAFPLTQEQTAMWRVIATTGWLPLLLILVSNYTPQPLAVFRYGFIAFPGLILLAGYGLWMVPLRYARVCLLLAWSICAVQAYGAYLNVRRTGMRECLRVMEKRLLPNDVIVTTPGHGSNAVFMYMPGTKVVVTPHWQPKTEVWALLRDLQAEYDRIWVFEIWDQLGVAHLPGWNERMGDASLYLWRKGSILWRYDSKNLLREAGAFEELTSRPDRSTTETTQQTDVGVPADPEVSTDNAANAGDE